MREDFHFLYRKIALWTVIPVLFFLAILFARIFTREPQAVYADTKDKSSVYYSSNADASQENTASALLNSKNIKKYAVRIQDGQIAVFEIGSSTPLYTIDTPPSRLPYADRLLLESGITTDTFEEARRLIEDYE